MKIMKTAFGTLAAVILIGAIGASAMYWRLESGKSIANPGSEPTKEIWNAVNCRARISSIPSFSSEAESLGEGCVLA
jgi:hypothetical protein